ncbi:hypothetical protein GCM10009634_33030 [Saccharothrix xinjiangensis]
MVTPGLRQPDDPVSSDPMPDTGDNGPADVRNTMSGIASVALQTGAVHGGVHLHTARPSPAPVVPRQLPAAPGLLAGRAGELARLDRALTAGWRGSDIDEAGPATADPPAGLAGAGTTVLVSAIGGVGGIGKTWLALAWAHRHLDRFPDGQLFVDLRGFSPVGEPMEPAVAVRGFLDALEVDPDRIPTDLDAQAALYRSLVAGRRMLIVLDNAAASEQVVPLLPGSPTCTVLVTGRVRLASLIDRHGARHLPLGILTGDEARVLLADRLGADRTAAAPEAVDELVGLCGGHPLALSIIARTVDTRIHTPLAEVAAEVRELGLEMLDHDTDPAASLPAVLSWSLRHLTEQQRTVFALLGIAPGTDTTLLAAAALTALPPARARRALSALEEASLLERRPGGRHTMHDLVRAYATTTARDNLSKPVREAALARAVDFYLHTAHAADQLLNPHAEPIRLDPPVPGARPHPLPDPAAALAWLDTWHSHLLAAQQAAATHGRHQVVLHLAWALDTFHIRRGHRHDDLAVWQAAVHAAAHLPDPAAGILAHRRLGRAYAELGWYEQAAGHLRQALAHAEHHHDSLQSANTHYALAQAWERQGNHQQALEHARRALDLYCDLDQPVRKAVALNAVGWHFVHLGDYDAARDHCLEALVLHRRHGFPEGEAATLDSLGLIAHRIGDHRQALDHYHQAVTLLRGLGDAYMLVEILDRVGHAHAALGHHDQVRTVWQEVLELYRQQGRDSDAQRVQSQIDHLDGISRAGADS